MSYVEAPEEIALCSNCPFPACIGPTSRKMRCPWVDAGYLKKEQDRISSMRRYDANKEAKRAKARMYLARKWQDPEFRKNHHERCAAYARRPDVRERRNQQRRERAHRQR